MSKGHVALYQGIVYLYVAVFLWLQANLRKAMTALVRGGWFSFALSLF